MVHAGTGPGNTVNGENNGGNPDAHRQGYAEELYGAGHAEEEYGAGHGEIIGEDGAYILGDTSLCTECDTNGYNQAQISKLCVPHLQCLNILHTAAECDGFLTSVSLVLGAKPPGDGTNWEVRTYAITTPTQMVSTTTDQLAMCRGRQVIKIDPYQSLGKLQTVILNPPLRIQKGQYPAILNSDLNEGGQGLEIISRDGGNYGCWRSMDLPGAGDLPTEVCYRLRMVGWYATLYSGTAAPATSMPVDLSSDAALESAMDEVE
jgi:hypothetical protein